MRTVLGVVVAVVLAVGCGGETPPASFDLGCEGPPEVSGCPEGMYTACDQNVVPFARVDSATARCVGTSLGAPSPECRSGERVCVTPSPDCEPTCEAGEPTCVEAPTVDDPELCTQWAATCAAMGAETCCVPAGTNDVTPC